MFHKSLLSLGSKIARKTVGTGFKAIKVASRIPGLKAIPVIGAASLAIDAARMAKGLVSPRTPGVLPSLPGMAIGGDQGGFFGKLTAARNQMAVPGANLAIPSNFDRNPGILPRGPGGKLQIPFSGANFEQFSQFSLDDQFLRQYVRAPAGYVVVRDANGKPFPMLKAAAKMMGLWRPAKKPPISVRDWSALKRANSTVNKIKRIVKMAENVSNFKRAPRRMYKAKAC